MTLIQKLEQLLEILNKDTPLKKSDMLQFMDKNVEFNSISMETGGDIPHIGIDRWIRGMQQNVNVNNKFSFGRIIEVGNEVWADLIIDFKWKNETITISNLTIFDFTDGKISKVYTQYDRFSIFQAYGMLLDDPTDRAYLGKYIDSLKNAGILAKGII